MNHREQHPDLYRRGPYLNKYAADPTQNKTKSKSQSADPARNTQNSKGTGKWKI